jgi:hypothetical protein
MTRVNITLQVRCYREQSSHVTTGRDVLIEMLLSIPNTIVLSRILMPSTRKAALECTIPVLLVNLTVELQQSLVWAFVTLSTVVCQPPRNPCERAGWRSFREKGPDGTGEQGSRMIEETNA